MLSKFFILTFIGSWLWFGAAAYALRCNGSGSNEIASVGSLLFIPGVFAPALVALVLTARSEGRRGVFNLLQGIAKWRIDVRWYLFAIGYMAAAKLGAAAIYRVVVGASPSFTSIPWYLMAFAIILSTPVQAGEEIGWRAFALPRLTKRFGLSVASVVLGIIWACWHLPFFFIPGSDNFGQSFSMYAIAVTALSVAMAWLYWRTNQSLLLTMLMHGSVNNTAGLVTSPGAGSVSNPFALNNSLFAWITVSLFWICAAYFLVRMRGQYWRIARIRLPLFL